MNRPELARRVNALAQFVADNPLQPKLSERDSHHLFKVLRARDGEEVVVTDGSGTFSITQVHQGSLERVSDVMKDEPLEPCTLYLAPLKGDRSEWAVAKATEIGVTRVVPLMAQRVVVSLKGSSRDKLVQKWTKVAHEAANQCRRSYALQIGSPIKVSSAPSSVTVADFDGGLELESVREIAIGPEGGWAPDEWPTTQRRLSLGPMVLRAETAAVVAATLMQSGQIDWPRLGHSDSLGNDEGTR